MTLGTFASKAIAESGLIYRLGAKGLVYLGVTDPKRAGLDGRPKVAGVRYGTGGVDYGNKIAELFPDSQKLVFIYQNQDGNIQDQAIATDLTTLNDVFEKTKPNARRPRFEIMPIDKIIEIVDLQEANPSDPVNSDIYFAWYGLDNILAKENKTSLINEKLWIIPSTFSEKNFNAAGIVVTVDDRAVGRLGAEIVTRHFDDPLLNLDQEPIRAPNFRVWINRPRVAKKGIRLLEAALHRDADGDTTYTYETSIAR